MAFLALAAILLLAAAANGAELVNEHCPVMPNSPATAEISDRIRDMVNQARELFLALAEPKAVTRELSVAEFESVYFGEGKNDSEDPLGAIYSKASSLMVFVVTLAQPVCDRISQLLAENDLAVARAELQANRARLRSAEIELDYTRITAPIDGVVAEVSTREGETVAAAFAAPNFVTIIDLERLEVLAYVDETDIGRVVVGQLASFTVDTFPDTEFTARVTAIQPRAELQGSVVNYLADGSAYGAASGDTFSFAPIQLPNGAVIKELTCVMRDNTSKGYIQATLNRGPINTTDPIGPVQNIASAVTFPATTDAGFVSRAGTADSSVATVDNSRYGYFFRVDFLDGPSPGGDPALKLRGCTVEYKYME